MECLTQRAAKASVQFALSDQRNRTQIPGARHSLPSPAGTHRRFRRADVEAHRVGSIRITRDHRRSLWLARAVTVTDRDTHLATARDNLTALRSTARGRAVTWVNEWDRLLGWPLHGLLDALTTWSTWPSSPSVPRHARSLPPRHAACSDLSSDEAPRRHRTRPTRRAAIRPPLFAHPPGCTTPCS